MANKIKIAVNKIFNYFLIPFLVVTAFLFSEKANSQQVLSPDGKIVFEVFTENGHLFYSIIVDKNRIIEKSALGFEFKNQPALKENLTITSKNDICIDETWKPVLGYFSEVRNNYNQSVFTIKETKKPERSINIIVRVYNNGAAFRYFFPEDFINDSLLIVSENTEFNFAKNHIAWWIPSDEFALESLWRKTLLSETSNTSTPITIETISGHFLCIHEAALINYSEMFLKKNSEKPFSYISGLWPEPDGVCVRAELPFTTPWRSISIARKPGELIESYLIQNLNEPSKIEDVSWIKPIKFAGIWWGMHTGKYTWHFGDKHGATSKRTKEYIDFASEHGIEGVLAEGWNLGWETWTSEKENIQNFSIAYSDFNLKEVVEYAKSKNVQFISHHETGSNIPVYESQLDSAFQLMKNLGITALKTGYAGPIIPKGYHHRGQFMIKHFQKVVETAAKYNICLNVHEGPMPTGLERTWPNLMTTEAIRGNEWNATYNATPPYHAVILPFTRFLAGPADFTPGIFKILHSPEKNKRLYTTIAHQLSHFVVMYSPMKMLADDIENYQNHPAFKFIEDVPSTWDETKVLDTKLGEYLCVARRKGNEWFIGCTGNENAHLLKIPLNFTEKSANYLAEIYCDHINTNWETNPEIIEIGQYLVSSGDTIFAPLSKAGGMAIRLIPVEVNSLKNIQNIQKFNNNSKEKMTVFSKIKTYGNNKVEHLAVNKAVDFITPFSEKYVGKGNITLTDGEKGTYSFSDGNWLGFYNNKPELIVDLGQETEVRKIITGFYHSPNDWIFHPEKVEVWISSDGLTYEKIGEKEKLITEPEDIKTVSLESFEIEFAKTKTQYVKIIARNSGNCPKWHYAPGEKSWIFIDEVEVF
ncbi:MAG: glycoside hydrolase family 97 catalytic domain-containing protein [Bacteroidales bacterium]|nr:glycoside hydrolase family 97 catalytic domain-containing protein [Bacteroidales bacterium]